MSHYLKRCISQNNSEKNTSRQEIIVIGITVNNTYDFGEHLSSEVASAVPTAVTMVLDGAKKHLEEKSMSKEFEPNILGFLCNWCSYAGADLAGTSQDEISIEPEINPGDVLREGRPSVCP